ncbi:MAG: hypothetical protein ACP5KI_03705 [Brevinematia bacterium]
MESKDYFSLDGSFSRFVFFRPFKLEKHHFIVYNFEGEPIFDITEEGLGIVLEAISKAIGGGYKIDTDLIELTEERCIVKVKLSVPKMRKSISMFGVATTKEVKMRGEDNLSILDDTLGLAQTRALKDSIEYFVGASIIDNFANALFYFYQN